MQSSDLSTTHLPLAAFLKCKGFEPLPGAVDPSGILEIRFAGDLTELQQLAGEFLQGGEVPALQYHHTLNELRGIIRVARAGAR